MGDVVDWTCREVVIRCVRVRDELKPIPIFLGDGPINADWLGITHCILRTSRRPDGIESFNLLFQKDDGEWLTQLEFETLEIAFDQASAIVGVAKHDWLECHAEITNDECSLSWHDVAGKNM
jgi:hypothetical protein